MGKRKMWSEENERGYRGSYPRYHPNRKPCYLGAAAAVTLMRDACFMLPMSWYCTVTLSPIFTKSPSVVALPSAFNARLLWVAPLAVTDVSLSIVNVQLSVPPPFTVSESGATADTVP